MVNMEVVDIQKAANILESSKVTGITTVNGMRATHLEQGGKSSILVQATGDSLLLFS